MQIIQHIELTGTQANIDFTSIPQTFTDLLLVYSLRTNLSGFAYDDTSVRFNSDSGNNYSNRQLVSVNGSVSSGGASGQNNTLAPESTGASATSNTFGSGQIYIANYTSSNAKSVSTEGVTETNSTATVMMINAGLWNSSSAITSIRIYSRNATSFVSGSSATLYGILKGSSGGVTVS